MDNCFICDRINLIKEQSNRYFVKELKSGYVVMGDYQFYKGYTVFLSKIHASELHELNLEQLTIFLKEMSIVAEAVYNAFKPDKLNYELLGNTDEHIHWHIFPRRKTDPLPHTAVWAVSKKIRRSVKPSPEELKELRRSLLNEINKIIDL